MSNCVQCGIEIEQKERIFEQRLIADTDFCGKCFKEIMNSEKEDLAYLDTLLVEAL